MNRWADGYEESQTLLTMSVPLHIVRHAVASRLQAWRYREALITAAVNGAIDMYTFDHEQHLERTAR